MNNGINTFADLIVATIDNDIKDLKKYHNGKCDHSIGICYCWISELKNDVKRETITNILTDCLP